LYRRLTACSRARATVAVIPRRVMHSQDGKRTRIRTRRGRGSPGGIHEIETTENDENTADSPDDDGASRFLVPVQVVLHQPGESPREDDDGAVPEGVGRDQCDRKEEPRRNGAENHPEHGRHVSECARPEGDTEYEPEKKRRRPPPSFRDRRARSSGERQGQHPEKIQSDGEKNHGRGVVPAGADVPEQTPEKPGGQTRRRTGQGRKPASWTLPPCRR